MEFPTDLRPLRTSREGIDVFGGFSAKARISDHEFSQMLNMGGEEYPCAAPRLYRSFLRTVPDPRGMIDNGGLAWAAGDAGADTCGFWYRGTWRFTLPVASGEKKLVNMGARILIFPDGVSFNTVTGEHEELANTFSDTAHATTLTICTLEGGGIEPVPDERPASPAAGDQYYEKATGILYEYSQDGWQEAVPANGLYRLDGEGPALYVYSAAAAEWQAVASCYVKIETSGRDIGSGFAREDGVTISGISSGVAGAEALNGTTVIYGIGEGYIIVPGILAEAQVTGRNVTVSRTVPTLDYVCELGNRIWGCRYGTQTGGGFVNELYACALGDPKNWQKYLGTAADSYRVSVGTPGAFTGMVAHLGYVMAFKKDVIHKVYGNRPSNFQLVDTRARGIAAGAYKSAAIIDETLFYLSRDDVVAIGAGLPEGVSGNVDPLGLKAGESADRFCCAGTYKRKYYLSCEDAGGQKHFLVYDPAYGNWYREDALDVHYAAQSSGHLFLIAQRKEEGHTQETGLYVIDCPQEAESGLYRVEGDGPYTETDADVPWRITTGLIGLTLPDHKRVSNVLLRLDAFSGANVAVDVRFDNQDRDETRPGASPAWGYGWHTSFDKRNMENRNNIRVPIRTPPRCDTMQISIHGQGKVRLYSLVKTIEVSEEW